MKKNKIAIVLALFVIMVVEVIQGCDRETFVSLLVVTSVVALIPVRYFRWLGQVSAIIAMIGFGPIGCVTKNNITSKAVTPGPWGTNIVTHEDKSWSVNQFGSAVNHNGNLFHFRAAVGGGVPEVGGRYGYNVGPGGYGYPTINVPIESQRYYERETWRRYGFDGGSGGGGGGYGHQGSVNDDVQKFYNLSGPGSGPRGYGY